MPAVQSAYQERIDEFYEGQIIDPHTCDVSTYIAEAAIGFGRPIIRGSGDDLRVVMGIAPTTGGSNPFPANEFYGISIKDPTRDPEENDQYRIGAHVNVMWRGDIVVMVTAAVSAGGVVRVDSATNRFTSAAASATIRTITGARFLRDASANGLSIVRLYGNEQLLATS